MEFRVETYGMKELQGTLKLLQEAVSVAKMSTVLLNGAAPITNTASHLAPRSDVPPHMADNIRAAIVPGRTRRALVRVGPTQGFEYARFQEWGTSRHAAQPFMRPAFDTASGRAQTRIATDTWALIKKGIR